MRYATRQSNAVITDIKMPHKDGIALIETMRADEGPLRHSRDRPYWRSRPGP